MDSKPRAAANSGTTRRGGAVGGPAQGARRPDPAEDGGLGRDRTRRPTGPAPKTPRKPPPGRARNTKGTQ